MTQIGEKVVSLHMWPENCAKKKHVNIFFRRNFVPFLRMENSMELSMFVFLVLVCFRIALCAINSEGPFGINEDCFCYDAKEVSTNFASHVENL